MINNITITIYITVRNVCSWFRILPFRLFGLHIGRNVYIGNGSNFSFFSLRNIHIENNVFIQKNCSFSCLPSTTKDKFGTIHIGINTHINEGAHFVSNNEIIIGNHCLFANNVSIFDHEHEFSKKTHPTTSGLTKGKTVVIGNNVYLGSNVVVLKGCHLGDHVVVGANAVVTKSFPAYSVIAGVPAKIVRKL